MTGPDGDPEQSRDPQAGPVLVIGIGNAYRGDDAAGLAVVQRISAAALPGVEVVQHAGEPVSLIDSWGHARAVYLVDATSSGGEAGRVHRFDATAAPLGAPFSHRGTHAFGVADTIELARALGRLPPRIIVYGIEGGCFAAGSGLSPAVRSGVSAASGRLLTELAHDRCPRVVLLNSTDVEFNERRNLSPSAGLEEVPVKAMIIKEFRQLRRDRRTLAMMIVMPVLLLVVLGYAASFDVSKIPTVVTGPAARPAAAALPKPFQVVATRPADGAAQAQSELRDGHAAVAIVTGAGPAVVLIDGSQLFTAQAAQRALAGLSGAGRAGTAGATGITRPAIRVLYNPGLKTSDIMIPGLAGVILVFVGTVITSLGVVRERQAGTLEQLAVMPLRPRDVFLGKITPYFAVALADLAIVLTVGVVIFGVPFRGSAAVFALGALLFVFVTLGIGVLISSVSQTQGQAIQLAIMTLLPQVLLSGLIFPLSSIAAGVRWIAYLLPLTYFNEIARGVMLRAEPLSALWQPFCFLALLGVVVVTLAIARFRAFLAPAPRGTAPRPGNQIVGAPLLAETGERE